MVEPYVFKHALGTNEERIVLYPNKEGIVAKILFYQEEIQLVPMPQKPSIDKNELTMAKTLMDSMIGK